MSLTTSFGITVPCNPEMVFLAARRIIGIPGEWPFELMTQRSDKLIFSEPADFGAMLVVWHHDGLPIDLEDDAPTIFVRVSLDSSYDPSLPNPFELHRKIMTELGAWCDSFGLEWWTHGEQEDGWSLQAPPYSNPVRN
jgi:hypothetical protein